MPAQNGPSEAVKALIESLGGSLWTTATDMVAGGTGTARTEIEQHRVPDAARMLVGWRPIEYAADQAADESILAVFDIAGVNFNFQPQEVICGCVSGSILTDSAGLQQAPSEYYDAFAPVAGGETISVGVEPCDAIAGNRSSAVEFTWTDKKLPLPVIYSLCSREVAVSAAGITAGTTLNINNAHKLIEVGGVFTPAVTTIEEEALIRLEISCTVLSPIQSIQALLEPHGAVANLTTDNGSTQTYLARRCQRLKFTTDRATILTNFNLDIAQTAAGQAVHNIRWI